MHGDHAPVRARGNQAHVDRRTARGHGPVSVRAPLVDDDEDARRRRQDAAVLRVADLYDRSGSRSQQGMQRVGERGVVAAASVPPPAVQAPTTSRRCVARRLTDGRTSPCRAIHVCVEGRATAGVAEAAADDVGALVAGAGVADGLVDAGCVAPSTADPPVREQAASAPTPRAPARTCLRVTSIGHRLPSRAPGPGCPDMVGGPPVRPV